MLTKLGLLSDADLTQALAKYLDIGVVAAARVPVAPVMPDIVDADFVRRSKILPLAVSDGSYDALDRLGTLSPHITRPAAPEPAPRSSAGFEN